MNILELKKLKNKMNLIKKDLPKRKRISNAYKGAFNYDHSVNLNEEEFWVEIKDGKVKFFSKKNKKVILVSDFDFMYDILMLTNVFRNLYDFIIVSCKYKDDLIFSIQKMTEEEARKENKKQITGNSYLVATSDNCTIKFKCFELIEEK